MLFENVNLLRWFKSYYCIFNMDVDEIKASVIDAVIILNVTFNVLGIAVIVKYPQLLFIYSLTLSDLANGCTAMPINAALCSSLTPNVRNMVHYFPKIHASQLNEQSLLGDRVQDERLTETVPL